MATIYLGDLTHTTITISNEAFPLNVGYVGAYAKEHYPKINIELFKYPDDLKKAIDSEIPDIIGLSNYPWNLNLNISFLKYIKSKSKNVITVMGGPNISYNKEEQHRMLSKYKDILDFYVLFEGEKGFENLIEKAIMCNFDMAKLKSSILQGVIFFIDGKLSEYRPVEREKDLEKIPSPYLQGLMDKFFDDRLAPMIETHRGCPYLCTYCHEGHSMYKKVAKHSLDRIFGELEYISARVGGKVKNLLIADPNFGIFTRDIEIAEKIAKIYDRTAYPQSIIASSAKNSKKILIEISNKLGKISMPIWMSVQSMTKDVLQNIKRRNISTDDMLAVQRELAKNNISSKSDLIMCLPGETLATHIESLIELIKMRMDVIITYQLMLVQGSEMKSDMATKEKFSFLTKYRAVARNFSDIKEIGKSIETEEIVVGTKDFNFDDYLKGRLLHLLVSIFYNGKGFEGFFRLIDEYKLDLKVFIFSLLEIFMKDKELYKLTTNFSTETKGELLDSEDEVKDFYLKEENFKLLADGLAGANLLQKYTAVAYMEKNSSLINVIKKAMLSLSDNELYHLKVEDIVRYYQLSFEDFICPKRRSKFTKGYFTFDITRWLNSKGNLDSFRFTKEKEVTFYTPDDQFELVENCFHRFGRGAQAFGKIMTRVWIADMLRKQLAA